MRSQIDKEIDAERRRDAGMHSSSEHAERTVSGWSDHALRYLALFAAAHNEPWTAEEMREWAHDCGLSKPDDLRAWGGVVARALNRHTITRIGYGRTNSSNRSFKPQYIDPAFL